MAQIANDSFVNLHVHTDYSILDGAAKIADLVDYVKELGQTAVGITDHGNMHGAYEMWSTAVKAGIKPIIGIEAYVTPDTARQDKTRVHWGTEDQRSDDVSGGGAITHMTMWAENDEGLVNLMKASSVANLEGLFGKWPRMDKEVLSTYHKGIIATTGCPSGIVQTRLRLGQFDEALRAAGEYQDIFGKENYYVELMDHGLEIEHRVRNGLIEIARKIGAPLVVTNDSHYVTAEGADAQDDMLCINSGARKDDPDRFKFNGSGYYIRSAQEMREMFKEFPEACDNTLEIAERCNVMFDDHEDGAFMPEFDCPEGWDATSLFLKKVDDGLKVRYPDGVPEEVAKQADYECGVICQMQFCGYFLVVSDYINWAKTHGVMVGPGRGSAAGSMVSYAMGITELDPLKHGLIFERFLNPERVSLPDIDVDFDPEGRMKVLEYVTQKYGRDKVAQCVTYGTFKTKKAIKDSSRIMGFEYGVGDRLCKALPPSVGGKDIKLKDVYNPDAPRYSEAEEFRKLVSESEDYKRIYDKACGIEDLNRQTGVHACATIMASNPITDTAPLMKRTDGTVTTAFEYHTCETLGLVKMDFLGLANLTVMRDTIENIEINQHKHIELGQIPLDDKETYQLLSRGDTLGVFQLDSDGMRGLLRQLKPDNFNDISALIALYRPGPMDMNSHINYAKRKNGLQEITPIHPEVDEPLKGVLGETYGLIVYQEQVQSAARILAGYSLGRADVLRRAMGKKKPEVLAKEQGPFFQGMMDHGYSREAAQAVWDVFLPFAGYAFNKAHSAAYGLISYWTAYLKTHYPVEFMAALLQNERDNKDKTALYLGEARRMGIHVLQPDINESVSHYSAVGDIVRFGLGAIRNVGDKVVEDIVKERNENGKFTDFLDFVKRVPITVLNKRVIESLIKGGAFDSLNPNRRALFTVSGEAIDQYVPIKRHEAEGVFDLFSVMGDDDNKEVLKDALISIPDIPDWDKHTRLTFERDMLGLYVSDHPLNGMSAVLDRMSDVSIAKAIEMGHQAGDHANDIRVAIAGLITDVTRKVNKKGIPWAIITVEDLDASIHCMCFNPMYPKVQDKLMQDNLVRVSGSLSARDDEVEMRANDVELIHADAADDPLEITLAWSQCSLDNLTKLAAVLQRHSGLSPVKLTIECNDGKLYHLAAGDRFRVDRDSSIFGEIKALFGPRCIA